MKKTLLLAALMVISVQARAVELGISGGVRNWEGTARNSEHLTPQVMLTVGNSITPKVPIRLDAVAGAWLREVPELHSTTERPGFQIGVRTMLDNRKSNETGKRLVRPVVGIGYYFKSELRNWSGHQNWLGDNVIETVLGLAIPAGLSADFIFQFNIALETDETDKNEQSFSLGYRFRVL